MGKKVGRPSKLNVETLKKGIKNALREGKTIQQIADMYEVHKWTLYRWFEADPEFRDTIKECKAQANDSVKKNFYSRTKWQQVEEVREVLNPQGEIVKLKTVKTLPPEPNVMRTWLQFRCPDEWGIGADNTVQAEEEIDDSE